MLQAKHIGLDDRLLVHSIRDVVCRSLAMIGFGRQLVMSLAEASGRYEV
jgi:hypothetical protein